MKNENLESRSWDDLVFENRNHEYGAYVIRRSYSDNLLSGTFVSVLIAALVLLVPLLSSFRGKDPAFDDKKGKKELVLEVRPDIQILPPPVAPPPPSVKPPVKVPSSVLPPRVVTHDVEADLQTNDEIVASLSPEGEEGGVPSETGGPGIVEPPAIVEPEVLLVAEEMPQFEGGLAEMYRFIQRKMKYPAVPRRMEIEGTVFVSFVIDAQGNVSDVKVIKGAHADLDKEAARVIALLPAWKPGKQHNRNVAVRMSLPIKFTLSH